MAFQYLGRPSFPLGEELDQLVHVAMKAVASQERGRCWRRAGAGVEQADRDLTARERLVQDWQVADDDGEESETDPGFRRPPETVPQALKE